MANNFQITISAIDKATAVVRKVNDSVSRAVRPFAEIKRASVALSKEVGLDRMGKSLGNVGKAAADVGEKMSRIIAPLAAVTGVGSIAAISELAKKWGELGSEINRTSLTLGVSAGELQALRGAAQLSGVPVESLTGGLKSLGDTMEDALYGRNQQALMMMNRLGITMKRNADGAVDTTAAFSDLAGSIANIKNPQVQGLVARTFGLEAVLPLLRKGKDGIAELTDEMRRSGAIMSGPQIAAASAFQQSMARLDLATTGLKNTIGSALIPILQPLVEKITAWTMANKELIATKFAEVAKGIADAIAKIDWNSVVDGAIGFVKGIKDVVDWLGGWKNAMIALVIVMNGSLIASVLNLSLALVKFSATAIPAVMTGIGLLRAGFVGLALKSAVLSATAFPALSEAIFAFGVALEATPIGWILTGIAAIAAAVWGLVKAYDAVTGASKKMNDANSGKHFVRNGRYGGAWVEDAAHPGQHFVRGGRSGSWVANAAQAATPQAITTPAVAAAQAATPQAITTPAVAAAQAATPQAITTPAVAAAQAATPQAITTPAVAAAQAATPQAITTPAVAAAQAATPQAITTPAVAAAQAATPQAITTPAVAAAQAATPQAITTPAVAAAQAATSQINPFSPGLLSLVRKLENSGDQAVSPAGAIGRYQIMPNTARQYGFDPAKLTNPAYNEQAASAVLKDLQKRYGNDNDAILAAYNAGPGRANQFLAAGRNTAVLPSETQKYLAHAHSILSQTGPAVATPYAAAPTQQEQMAAMGITTTTPAIANGGIAKAQPMQPGSQGAVTVQISFENAPPGMKSKVQTKGAVSANTKINYDMSGVGAA